MLKIDEAFPLNNLSKVRTISIKPWYLGRLHAVEFRVAHGVTGIQIMVTVTKYGKSVSA